MKTEDAIKKLNEHYGVDCLGVDAQDTVTFFKINFPNTWGNELGMIFKRGQIYNILQFNGYTSLLFSIQNKELALL